jgi:hypothetical protein
MPRARVYNDNTHPKAPAVFEQEFRGTTWRIPKGEFIEADYVEAVEFKGQYYTPIVKNLAHQPEGFKMIRVEKILDEVEDEPEVFINHFTGERFASKAEWEQSLKANEGHLHDKDKERVRKSRAKADQAARAL